MNDIQKKQLEILKAFIRVCDKYNLRYFMVGGSALGAARHKGFIPWDDDIDVGMPREDYDKYITLQKEYEGTPYFVKSEKEHSLKISGLILSVVYSISLILLTIEISTLKNMSERSV